MSDPPVPPLQFSLEQFTALLDRCQWPLYTFLRGIMGDDEQARDLMQDTFYDAWRTAQQGIPPLTAPAGRSQTGAAGSFMPPTTVPVPPYVAAGSSPGCRLIAQAKTYLRIPHSRVRRCAQPWHLFHQQMPPACYSSSCMVSPLPKSVRSLALRPGPLPNASRVPSSACVMPISHRMSNQKRGRVHEPKPSSAIP